MAEFDDPIPALVRINHMNITFKFAYGCLISAMFVTTLFVHASSQDDHSPVLLSSVVGEMTATGDFLNN